MIKRYSLPTEAKAKELILLLAPQNEGEEEGIDFRSVQVTETTHAVVCLGFQNKYNEEGELIKEGTTFDVDVMWKNEANENWNEYEINPNTPNHNFA